MPFPIGFYPETAMFSLQEPKRLFEKQLIDKSFQMSFFSKRRRSSKLFEKSFAKNFLMTTGYFLS